MTRRTLSLLALSCVFAVGMVSASAQGGAASAQPGDQPWPPAGVARMSLAGVQAPTLVKESKPNYTKAAMDAGIHGTLEVEAIVEANGRVGEVRVIRSLDKEHGLDEEAVKAVKAWEFKPGRKDGKAVPVLVNIELTFAVRPR